MIQVLTPYVVIVPLISFFFILYAWNHVWRGTKTVWEAVLWTAFWGFAVFVVLFPAHVRYLTYWTGIKNQENAIFAIAIGCLLFIVFHLVISFERQNKRIADLVRFDALRNAGLIEGLKDRE